MIGTTRDYLVKFLKDHPVTGKVLEVGCLDVNGNVRDILSFMEYMGIDMRDGRNVDKVVNAHDIKENFTEGEFDLVICFDTLEHDNKFWISVENMRWVLKKGGWLIIGTPSINHGIHDHPDDYYRFTESVYKEVFFEGMSDKQIESQFYFGQDTTKPDQVFGYARKQ
jgi:SAM-dependent methyltransferase